MRELELRQGADFIDLPEWRDDRELRERVLACLQAQRRAMSARAAAFQPAPDAERFVSEESLMDLLADREDIQGIATQHEISNVIPFNARNLAGALMDAEVARLRKAVDAAVASKLQHLLAPQRLTVTNSGHFLYPPGGYMGWHTNSDSPGWRLYITHAEEPGRSFFRHRDPGTGEVITSWDEEWSFRMFRIARERPLWHAVYSETNRFSLGYIIQPRSLGFLLRWHGRRVGLALRRALSGGGGN